MNDYYKKFCYDDNPHYRLHHTIEACSQHSIPAHLHYDTSLVLTYYRKGTGNIRIEGQFYQINPGDIVLLNPNEMHVCTIDGGMPHERIALYIKDSILEPFNCGSHTLFDAFYKRPNGQCNLICAANVEKYHMDEQLQKILQLIQENSEESIILATCAIIELLSLLKKVLTTQPTENLATSSGNKRINEVMQYLNANYDKQLNIDMIAERFHFSKYHLCRMFKEYVGTTIGEYLICKRLITFNQLVCQNYSLEEASCKVGFHNYSNFYRLYKKHMGITPTQYKQKALEK